MSRHTILPLHTSPRGKAGYLRLPASGASDKGLRKKDTMDAENYKNRYRAVVEFANGAMFNVAKLDSWAALNSVSLYMPGIATSFTEPPDTLQSRSGGQLGGSLRRGGRSGLARALGGRLFRRRLVSRRLPAHGILGDSLFRRRGLLRDYRFLVGRGNAVN